MNMSNVEIIIPTYNRPHIIKKWFDCDLQHALELGFAIAVYDSSTNDETENLIKDINKNNNIKINYVRIDNNIRIDEKVLISILDSEYDYVWPLGDSRTVNFDQIRQKVIPYIEEEFDFSCIYSFSHRNNDRKIYTDSNVFFKECFWHATLLGGIIFKRDIFSELHDEKIYAFFKNKYCRNDGFSYLGIFYDLIANKSIKASFSIVEIQDICVNKKPAWLRRYLEVWCDNLCYLMDQLDSTYDYSKEIVLKEVWTILGLDKVVWCYKARVAGGLSGKLFDYYDNRGEIERVSTNKRRFRIYSKMPIVLLKTIYDIRNLCGNLYRRIKRVCKGDWK